MTAYRDRDLDRLDRLIDDLNAGRLDPDAIEDPELSELLALARDLKQVHRNEIAWPGDDFPRRLAGALAPALRPPAALAVGALSDGVAPRLPERRQSRAEDPAVLHRGSTGRPGWLGQLGQLAAAAILLTLLTATLVTALRGWSSRAPSPAAGPAVALVTPTPRLPAWGAVTPEVKVELAPAAGTPNAATPDRTSPDDPAVGVPLPPIGQPFDLPGMAVHGFTLVRSAQDPPFSLQEAMQIAKDAGIPFAMGGEWQGRKVSVTAAFGLGTFNGVSHVPVHGTDIILDSVKNRPMWIIDYGNLTLPGSKGVYNHGVYAVDSESRTVLYSWTYQADTGQATPSPVSTCNSSQLEGTLLDGGAAAGHVRAYVELRNTASQACVLIGYPQVQLLDAQGQPVPVQVQDLTGTGYFGTVPAAAEVVLPPGSAPLDSGEHLGHAFFALSWNDVCPNPATMAPAVSGLAITPPGASAPTVVGVELHRVCDPGIEPVTDEPPAPVTGAQATPIVNAPAATAPACRADQLRLDIGGPVAEPTGQHTLALTLTNRSAQPCSLNGYPAVALLDSSDRPLPFDFQQHGDQMVTSQPPQRFDLAAGANAYVTINKYRCDQGDQGTAGSIEMTLPPDKTPLKLALPPDAASLAYCGPGDSGSQVAVSPFEPTFAATTAHP